MLNYLCLLYIDEELKPLRSESVPLSRDIFNQIVSQNEILFPFNVYRDETLTQLINMKGYKKLIVMMSASDITSPASLSSSDALWVSAVPNILVLYGNSPQSAQGYRGWDTFDSTSKDLKLTFNYYLFSH